MIENTKKMKIGEQMYEIIKAYNIDERSISKEMRESLEIYKAHFSL